MADLRQLGLECLNVSGARGWWRVASVHAQVQQRAWHAGILSSSHNRVEVLLVTVNAAIAEQPEEVEAAGARLGGCEGIDKGGLLCDRAILDGPVDADEVLVVDRTGADGKMPHLAIAHGVRWQPDGETCGLYHSKVGIRPEAVHDGCLCLHDRVPVLFRAFAPSIDDDKGRTLGW